jgi:hypothetical protein
MATSRENQTPSFSEKTCCYMPVYQSYDVSSPHPHPSPRIKACPTGAAHPAALYVHGTGDVGLLYRLRQFALDQRLDALLRRPDLHNP